MQQNAGCVRQRRQTSCADDVPVFNTHTHMRRSCNTPQDTPKHTRERNCAGRAAQHVKTYRMHREQYVSALPKTKDLCAGLEEENKTLTHNVVLHALYIRFRMLADVFGCPLGGKGPSSVLWPKKTSWDQQIPLRFFFSLAPAQN